MKGSDGPPIAVLRGGESAFRWVRVIPNQVTIYRVVFPRLPGYDASEVTDTPWMRITEGAPEQ